mmetsp:Transcript_88982/g.235384  ORF Transcript_88982/g.235384 Transcript_88982/m.235384 type:complete len:272 (-) Transcript_88982:878-1693(-)
MKRPCSIHFVQPTSSTVALAVVLTHLGEKPQWTQCMWIYRSAQLAAASTCKSVSEILQLTAPHEARTRSRLPTGAAECVHATWLPLPLFALHAFCISAFCSTTQVRSKSRCIDLNLAAFAGSTSLVLMRSTYPAAVPGASKPALLRRLPHSSRPRKPAIDVTIGTPMATASKVFTLIPLLTVSKNGLRSASVCGMISRWSCSIETSIFMSTQDFRNLAILPGNLDIMYREIAPTKTTFSRLIPDGTASVLSQISSRCPPLTSSDTNLLFSA